MQNTEHEAKKLQSSSWDGDVQNMEHEGNAKLVFLKAIATGITLAHMNPPWFPARAPK